MAPIQIFFNIIHLSAIVRHVNCTFLNCFYTYLQLEMVISVFILIFSHIFCLCMFLINSGCSDMVYQMSSLPQWWGISLIWFKNHFLQYVYFCIPPKHFFSIMNVVGIVSHMTFLFPCHYSIHVYIYMPISVYILIFLHIFCLRMLGIDSGWSDIYDRGNPSYFTTDYSDIFVRWTPHSGCDIVPNWHLCQMFEYFCILDSTLLIFDAQSHIYHIYIYTPLFHENVILKLEKCSHFNDIKPQVQLCNVPSSKIKSQVQWTEFKKAI